MNITVDAEARVNSAVGHSSPSDQLRLAILQELAAGSNTAAINNITKLVLVDDANNERDSCTSPNYTDNSGNSSDRNVVISCIITATASYTVARVRAYSGSVLYFDAALATSVSVTAGQNVNTSMTIRIAVVANASGATTGAGRNADTLIINILKAFIAATRTSVNILQIALVDNAGTEQVVVTPTWSIDSTNKRATYSFSTSGKSYTLQSIRYKKDTLVLVEQLLNPLSISASDTLQVQITIST